MDNVVTLINKRYTYEQIATRIREKTGRVYSAGHIGNVARGSKPLNDRLLYNLIQTFPEFFLPTNSISVENFQSICES